MRTKKTIINTALLILCIAFSLVKGQTPASFKAKQMTNSRVKEAYTSKWPALEKEIKAKGIDPTNFELFIRIFKTEDEVELWLKDKNANKYTLLKKIAVCAKSGVLGPKRREGDLQVPEGIYDISVFNPNSDYFLAVKVGYPNKSDRILAKGPTGGDIMIHGNCVTIGCIPLQDVPVKDLYMLCVEARNRKSPIRVEIYPCHFNKKNLLMLESYPEEKNLFWSGIIPAYEYFETNKVPIKYKINEKGAYVFEK